MKESDRRHAIHARLVRVPDSFAASPLSTGFPVLDRALGGGLPRGRIIELFGPSSSGKTTLALQIVAALQSSGSTTAWIDAERSFDPSYAAALGVVLEALPVLQPDSAEEALEIGRRLAASGALDLLAVDSAAALLPHLEMEAGLATMGHGLHSRVLASGLRRLAAAIARSGTSVVFLNQTRARPDPSEGESETSAGGPPLRLHAAIRIALAPAAGRVRFRILKNRFAAPFASGELAWRPPAGFAGTP